MILKEVRIRKGMSKDDVNELISEWIELEDDIYMGDRHKHTWKCKCGGIIEDRMWMNIRRKYQIRCFGCIYEETESRYREHVDNIEGYEYIRSYRSGDILPNGKIVRDNPHIKIKHKLCGRVYIVAVYNFINNEQRCIKCCSNYEDTIGFYIKEVLKRNIEDVVDLDKTCINLDTTSKNSHQYFYAKCTNKHYHKSYRTRCDQFVKNLGCKSCNPNTYKDVHPYDSFGYHNFDKAQSWSSNNTISPFKVSKKSGRDYLFICHECGREFKRKISNVANRNTLCIECGMYEGERLIQEYLINQSIKYIPQKEFNSLIGINGGNLSYDFYLEDYNILIEFQGDQHRRFVKTFHKSYKDFEKQLEHDKRKREYAENRDIILLELWEEDKNNIEEILNKEIINSNKLI